MSNKIELKNLELYEFCMLDKITGEVIFYKNSEIKGFTGLYFRDSSNFLGIYPSKDGPIIYYKGKEYNINPNLSISLTKHGKERKFTIRDYDIEIDYIESPYIGLDSWSDEVDVDLLYMIQQSYEDSSFYDKFTLKSV